MFFFHKNILFDICNKNIDIYQDLLSTIKGEYDDIISHLKDPDITCKQIRILIHKLIGVISILESANLEIMSTCKFLLLIDKKSNDVSLYKTYIKIIIEYSRMQLFGYI